MTQQITPAIMAQLQQRAMHARRLARARMGATRRPSPIRHAGSRPVLEQIINPLYDTESFVSGGANEIRFFSRPLGQAAVSGNNKTYRDTNMVTAGQIPNPKVAVVVGFRVVVSPISGDNDASPTVVFPLQSAVAAAMRAIYHETVSEFKLGSKTYVSRPTYQLPGNVGVDVLGWASSDADASASTITEADAFGTYYATGPYAAYTRTRLRLPPLQQFEARIYFPSTRRNDVPSGGSNTGSKVTWICDAIVGREVQ